MASRQAFAFPNNGRIERSYLTPWTTGAGAAVAVDAIFAEAAAETGTRRTNRGHQLLIPALGVTVGAVLVAALVLTDAVIAANGDAVTDSHGNPVLGY